MQVTDSTEKIAIVSLTSLGQESYHFVFLVRRVDSKDYLVRDALAHVHVAVQQPFDNLDQSQGWCAPADRHHGRTTLPRHQRVHHTRYTGSGRQ